MNGLKEKTALTNNSGVRKACLLGNISHHDSLGQNILEGKVLSKRMLGWPGLSYLESVVINETGVALMW